MDTNDALLIAGLIVALLSAVFLALAEASLLRISRFRAIGLAREGGRPAIRLARLLERLPAVLNLILFLALLSQVGAATLTGILAGRLTGSLGVTIASAVLTLVLFVYGEAIPKTYAVKHAERAALFVSGPISILDRILSPIVGVLVWIADAQLPGKGITTSPTVTEGELRLLAGEAAQEGEITGDDLDLIERAFRFGDRRVDDVMVPRLDVIAVAVDSHIDEAMNKALASGHRRLPVYTDNLDNVTGVVRLRDLVEAQRDGIDNLKQINKKPLVIPESLPITSLLTQMQDKNDHLAVVVDEYGVTVGLVTVEDIAEELLGAITDDQPLRELEQAGPDRWTAPGSLPVEDLSVLAIELPDGDWNTVAGLMLDQAGRILGPGDLVKIDHYDFKVESARGRRILRVSIQRRE